MKRRTILMGAPAATLLTQGCGLLGQAAGKRPLAKNDAEAKILGVIEEMARAKKTYLSVPDSDGRWLRLLTEAVGAQHVVEVGTSTGYSGLWFALALQNTGGKLTTFEIDSSRAQTARSHFRQAGVDELITVVWGDAHKRLPEVRGPIDVVFIDADKRGYPHYLELLLPIVRPGGLLLAHNVDMSPEYVDAVTSNPDLETVFYMDGGELGVTLKKL